MAIDRKLARLWLYFRLGHSTYLVFAYSFAQFIIIAYALLIDRIPFLKALFPRMSLFIVFFLASYIPIAIVMGLLHKKVQMPIEAAIALEQNPYFRKLLPKERALFIVIGRLCEKAGVDASELGEYIGEKRP